VPPRRWPRHGPVDGGYEFLTAKTFEEHDPGEQTGLAIDVVQLFPRRGEADI
jgi:hypothetical protein